MDSTSETDLTKKYDGLQEASKPLVDWLRAQVNPHCKVIVDQGSVELLEGVARRNIPWPEEPCTAPQAATAAAAVAAQPHSESGLQPRTANASQRSQLVTVRGPVDGNAFGVIGAVRRQLIREGFRQEAEIFQDRAFNAGSYDQLLVIAKEYAKFEGL